MNIGLGSGELWLIKGSSLLRILMPSLALLQNMSPPFFPSLLHCSHPASVAPWTCQVPSFIKNFGCSLCLGCLSLRSCYHSILSSIVTSSERTFLTNLSLFIPILLPAFGQHLSLLEIILSTCLSFSLTGI